MHRTPSPHGTLPYPARSSAVLRESGLPSTCGFGPPRAGHTQSPPQPPHVQSGWCGPVTAQAGCVDWSRAAERAPWVHGGRSVNDYSWKTSTPRFRHRDERRQPGAASFAGSMYVSWEGADHRQRTTRRHLWLSWTTHEFLLAIATTVSPVSDGRYSTYVPPGSSLTRSQRTADSGVSGGERVDDRAGRSPNCQEARSGRTVVRYASFALRSQPMGADGMYVAAEGRAHRLPCGFRGNGW